MPPKGKTNTVHTDVVIIGAGASGLFCAAAAIGRGRKVVVLERAAAPCRKVAVSGGGRANFSNLAMGPEYFVSENPAFAVSALRRFPPVMLTGLLDAAGIPWEEREHGQLFCVRSADDLVDFLLSRIRGAALLPQTFVQSARKIDGAFVITVSGNGTSRKERYMASSLVLATGNTACPQLGATDLGLRLAAGFGHRIVPPAPALAGFILPSDWPLAGLAGLSLPARLDIVQGPRGQNRPARRASAPHPGILPLLFTHRGISGPAALQASLYWRQRQELCLNFLPDKFLPEILAQKENGRVRVKTLLGRLLPGRLAARLCALTGPEIDAAKNTGDLNEAERKALSDRVHASHVLPVGTEGMKKAEVARGGVSTEHVSSRSMESSLTPGLYFCGELLDVTGRLGGYNLHWAFASGHAAGSSA